MNSALITTGAAASFMAPENLSAIHSLPVTSLAPSPTNPRRNFDPAALAELTASVRQHGVMQPILARPWPATISTGEESILFEIVAGERRWRAACAAGLAMIDVKVRDLADREVLELQIIENLQRAELHPLEEADSYGRMLTSYGYTTDELAAKIGKSKAYIYGRLKLRDLSREARSAFHGGQLTASTALLVARVPSNRLQSELLNELLTWEDGRGEPATVLDVKGIIQRKYTLALSGAPFSTDDDTLIPAAGDCRRCPKRTGNQPDIFDDGGDVDVCTDQECFAAKKAAHAARVTAQAVGRGLKVISGEEARKVAPYGVNDCRVGGRDDYIDLDGLCHDDESGRTWREVFGGDVEPVLIEDFRKGILVEAIQESVLTQKLIAAGVIQAREDYKAKEAAEQKKLKEKVEKESAFRERLLKSVREKFQAYRICGGVAAVPDSLVRMITRRLWQSAGYDVQVRVALARRSEGGSDQQRIEAFGARIDRMDDFEMAILQLDVTLLGSTIVNSYTLARQPKELLEAAGVLGIDPELVRKETTAEARKQKAEKALARKKNGKSETKPPVSETPVPIAEVNQPDSETTTPAVTQETTSTRESVGLGPVKYRHPDSGMTWSGRGRPPAWVSAWRAEGKTMESLEATSAAPIETASETPDAEKEPPAPEAAAEAPGEMHVGARVRVRAPDGKHGARHFLVTMHQGRLGILTRKERDDPAGPPETGQLWRVALDETDKLKAAGVLLRDPDLELVFADDDLFRNTNSKETV